MPDHAGLVDVHAHFLTPEYVAAATSAGIDHPDGVPRWPTWQEDSHLELMDRAAIDTALLSISSPGTHFGDDLEARRLTRSVNAAAAAVAGRHPDRFGWLASLPLPDVRGAVAELDHAAHDGADGYVLLTEAGGTPVADPMFDEVFAGLDDLGAVVLLHPTSGSGRRRSSLPVPAVEFPFQTTTAALELALAGMHERYPRIRLVLPHMGGALPVLVDRTQLFLDRSPRPTVQVSALLDQVWWDTAGAPLPRQLPALAATFGTGRIVFGSDYCWTPAEEVPAVVAALESGTPPSTTLSWRDLCAANATRLLAVPGRVARSDRSRRAERGEPGQTERRGA